jgi:hypothetical protein
MAFYLVKHTDSFSVTSLLLPAVICSADKMTSHLHVIPRLRTREALHPLSHMSRRRRAKAQGKLYLYPFIHKHTN